MIQTVNLTKRYGNFLAVDRINLNIKPGEIYGFLGPNGAGKTSTIMMLLGISRPTSGSISLFGENYSPDRFDLKKRIGVVPEKHPRGVWRWMTAREYLEYFAELFEVEKVGEKIKRLLKKVNLLDVENKRIDGFSRGMLQKLSIVRSLIHDPDILFLDEPISGLDPIGIKQVRDLIISENKEGRSIFVSSHLLSEMEKLCHKVAIIYQGRLLAEDTMEVLLNKLTKDKQIHVELEKTPPELAGQIRALEFVNAVSMADNTMVISVKKEGDYRKAVSEFLIKNGHVPLRLQQKMISLEDAFVTITQENVEKLAGIGGKNEG